MATANNKDSKPLLLSDFYPTDAQGWHIMTVMDVQRLLMRFLLPSYNMIQWSMLLPRAEIMGIARRENSLTWAVSPDFFRQFVGGGKDGK